MIKFNLQLFGGRGASGSGSIEESDEKPLGGNGSGKYEDRITVYPFRISPEDLKESIGEKGNAISIEKALEGANPFYNTGVEFNENCQRCVVAYELRRRGYDVVALPTYGDDKLPIGRKWAGAFLHGKFESVGASSPLKTQANLEAKMHEWGNGSRAIVAIKGHVFNAENVRGKIRYVDAQTNTIYNSNNVFSRLGKNSKGVEILRTDNLRLSDRAKKSVTPVTETMRRIGRTSNKKKQ